MIEYVLNMIHVHLQLDFDRVNDVIDLGDIINENIFIMDVEDYAQYFVHCGFNKYCSRILSRKRLLYGK